MQVDAEPLSGLDLVGDVQFLLRDELLLFLLRRQRKHELTDDIGREHARAVDRDELPVDAEERRFADHEVEIGRALRHGDLEQAVHHFEWCRCHMRPV